MDKDKKKTIAAYGLLLVSLFCMLYGIVRGEPDTVFRKAVQICLECIGIG